jgi:DNA (cytosine-5)-methyltransferase 1
MIFGSVCSGIEAASAAWLPLGWTCSFMAEIDAFPAAVLRHHYPDTPLHGDFTTIEAGDYRSIDVLVGGTPCQSFSVAGLRGGMEDARGNLALEYLRLADRLRPRWVVWENVPGVRSSNSGRDFGAFLGGLGELGYGWAYRSLDAQYLGLAQRRERVFAVGCLGDWRRAAAVLFEPASLRGDSAPGREARESVASAIAARTRSGGGLGTDFDCDGGLIAFGGNNTAGPIDVATAVNAHGGPHGRLDFESETFIASTLSASYAKNGGAAGGKDSTPHNLVTHALRADGFDASEDGTGRGTPLVAGAMRVNGDAHSGFEFADGLIPAISTVRRLMPIECERLQGFPDGYTDIPYRGKPAADGPRYKALGNSMAVPVMRWIGRRMADPTGVR